MRSNNGGERPLFLYIAHGEELRKTLIEASDV